MTPRTNALLMVVILCVGVGGIQPETFGLTHAGEPRLPAPAPPFLKGLPPVGTPYAPRQPITKKLQALIEKHEYRGRFEKAIQAVSVENIADLSRIKTLDQFYFYVDALSRWIPEIRIWEWNGKLMHERSVYLRAVQLYYYFDQPSLKSLQSPIAPAAGARLTPISRWLRDFAVEWGSFLDTPESSKYLQSFKYAPEYSWHDFEKPPEAYATFNEFFARKFKNMDVQRPVAAAKDDRVIVFPAESVFVGQWAISTPAGPPLPAPPSIVVKHVEWSIKELLSDSKHADDFEGGIFCHSFLNTYDYHGLHAPVAGKVLEARVIPGQVYLDVKLKERKGDDVNGDLARTVIPKRYLSAEDPTGYQFVQCRGLLVLESAIGKVAILPIGMAQVSSVVFVTPKADGHKPIQLTPMEKRGLDYEPQAARVNEKIREALVGRNLAKGEMFSYFQFGGSDCVMVFERKANVHVTAQVGVHYPIRSQFAVSNINK